MSWFEKISKKYSLSRRRFSQVIAALLSSFFIPKRLLLAQTSDQGEASCDLKESVEVLRLESDEIYFWVDGLHLESGLITSRATLAILIRKQQSADEYIDKAVLSDNQENLLGGRYFGPDDRTQNGYLPLLIFDNVDLSNKLPLQLNLQVRKGTTTERYRHVFPKSTLVRSEMDRKRIYLPSKFLYDMSVSHNGYISSLFRFRTSIPFHNFGFHLIKARVIHIGTDGSFSLQILIPHADESPEHYFRYFIVTDPVGQILGMTKREFDDGQQGAVVVNQLSEAQRTEWGLAREYVGNINDCPYIMVFAEDIKEGLTQGNVWLR